MSTLWSLGLFFLILGRLDAAEVCFDILGCFDDLPPWGGTAQRPASLVPWSPEEIDTRFLLFTQKSRYYQEITSDNIHASNYHGIRKTRFIIPGYLDKEDEDWPQEMCKAILAWENVNCIAVEWKRGVKTLYAQAVNNSRVVAAQVASMIRFLMGNYKQKADKFYIIGHSLGAHTAGDVGSQISNISRITGLDPVEPYFQDTPISVHLDTSDAAFVDVIHTDGLPFNTKLGLGMSRPLGHIDFYPNGGELMPGCSANRGKPSDLDAIWEGRKKFDACNHVRAYDYYIESLAKPWGFVGFPCSDAGSFAEGKCFPCADSKCPLMGASADKFPLDEGAGAKFFLTTGSSKPFGRYSYRLRLTLNGPSWPNPGIMYVALAGASDTTKEHQIHIGTMKPGRTYEAMVHAEVNVGDVTEVKFRWNNHIVNPLKPKYGASTVELQRGEDMKIALYCGTENVKENAVQSVLPCQL